MKLTITCWSAEQWKNHYILYTVVLRRNNRVFHQSVTSLFKVQTTVRDLVTETNFVINSAVNSSIGKKINLCSFYNNKNELPFVGALYQTHSSNLYFACGLTKVKVVIVHVNFCDSFKIFKRRTDSNLFVSDSQNIVNPLSITFFSSNVDIVLSSFIIIF